MPSFQRGPTPLVAFDPNDGRSMDVGTELLGSTWFGYLGLDGHLRIGPLNMAAVPAFQDLPIYFQGVTFGGVTTILDRISSPEVIRLGNAGTFRDRIVTFQDDRAFATVLERPDRTWMVVGGARGQLLAQSAHNSTAIYHPLDDQFTIGPMLNNPRSLHTQTTLQDGRTLLVGGVDAFNNPQASCEIYDPATDTFTLVASMNTPRMGHSATLLPDGRVFVAGGLDAVTVTPTQLSAVRDTVDTTEIYDPVTDTWTSSATMSDPRAAHVAILRPDGKVMLAGGLSWYSVIVIGWLPTIEDSCDIYDPATDTMASGPAMNDSRSFLEPVELGNDRWLLAGGIGNLTLTNLGTPTASAEIYDAVANTWTSVGPLNSARGYHRAWALDNGDFMLAGGADGNILQPNPLDSVEIFSPATNSFTFGPSMTIPRAAPAKYRTRQGQMQLFGGGTTNNTIVNSTEFYYF
ncbi:MAG: hypothetical protein NXI31_24340 [bacterium]|nr:hypothetical protein [bacterium]